jgi:diguanylate cyclase (GGDEF)-like protein
MLKISQAALSNVSLQELFQSIHQSISELLPAANFYIALYDQRTNILDFPYYVDQYDQPPLPAPPQKGLTEWVLRTKKPLFARPEIVDELVEKGEIVRIGTQAVDWLGVPLLLGDESIGVLVVQSYNSNERYTQEDLAILEFVSNQVAIAIDRKQSELRLQFLSTHDILTGLYNRVYFEEELTRLQQSRLFPISIVNMDVDGLKFVNDNLGHDKGDELLRRTAWLLKKGFRNEDMVARIGGDEFIVILPKTPEASANEVVNRLKNSIQNYNQNNVDFPIHLSVGIVTIEESNSDLREAIKLADLRMYDEKRRKKTGPLGT